MKKKIVMVMFTLLFCMVTTFPALAASDMPRLVDNADLLSNTEESALLEKLDEISERQQMDVVVVTTQTIDGKSPGEYADNFYDYNGYGFGNEADGILLLINMEDRDWYITTTGYGITAITDAGREYISEQFLSDLGEGKYADAFTTYADLCDEFITQAKTGSPYDVGNLPKKPFDFGMHFIIAFAIGLVAAVVATNIMKAKLKTVRFQSAAREYVRSGSMNVNEQKDLFLYTHVDRHRKPEPEENNATGGSSTHISSSGRTHGGGGGKF